MYKNILVTLDGTPTDRAIIDQIVQLAGILGSEVVLLHVIASALAQWTGSDADPHEVQRAETYLRTVEAEFEKSGISTSMQLAFGDPVTEIIKWVKNSECDLLAMSTHGHRLMGDLLHGVTASRVQHQVSVPVLLLRAQ